MAKLNQKTPEGLVAESARELEKKLDEVLNKLNVSSDSGLQNKMNKINEVNPKLLTEKEIIAFQEWKKVRNYYIHAQLESYDESELKNNFNIISQGLNRALEKLQPSTKPAFKKKHKKKEQNNFENTPAKKSSQKPAEQKTRFKNFLPQFIVGVFLIFFWSTALRIDTLKTFAILSAVVAATAIFLSKKIFYFLGFITFLLLLAVIFYR